MGRMKLSADSTSDIETALAELVATLNSAQVMIIKGYQALGESKTFPLEDVPLYPVHCLRVHAVFKFIKLTVIARRLRDHLTVADNNKKGLQWAKERSLLRVVPDPTKRKARRDDNVSKKRLKLDDGSAVASQSLTKAKESVEMS